MEYLNGLNYSNLYKGKTKAPKPIRFIKQWAYFSKDGYVQVRSIGYSRRQSREMLVKGDVFGTTYKHYEENGFYCRKVIFSISLV